MLNLPKWPLAVAILAILVGGYIGLLNLKNNRLEASLKEATAELELKTAEVKALNGHISGLKLQVNLNYTALADYQKMSQTARQIVDRAETIEPKTGVVDYETSHNAINFINDIFNSLSAENL